MVMSLRTAATPRQAQRMPRVAEERILTQARLVKEGGRYREREASDAPAAGACAKHLQAPRTTLSLPGITADQALPRLQKAAGGTRSVQTCAPALQAARTTASFTSNLNDQGIPRTKESSGRHAKSANLREASASAPESVT